MEALGAIPVCIVEDHNEMLPHVLEAVQSGTLADSGLMVVHVDAHPDMMATEGCGPPMHTPPVYGSVLW